MAADQAYHKLSASGMPPFLVSAPGKVIVYGEHAVVYGKVCNAPFLDRVLEKLANHRTPVGSGKCSFPSKLGEMQSQTLTALCDA